MREFRIEIDNTYIHIIQCGNGPKNLCVIPGASLTSLEGRGEAVDASYSLLQDEYTIYLIERRRDLPNDFSVHDMAEDVYHCFSELGIKETAVYGVSLGGMIAQDLAVSHPDAISKLIICSSMCRPTPTALDRIEEWKSAASERDVVKLNRLFFKDVYSPAYLEQFKDFLPELEKVGTAEDCDRFMIIMDAILAFDLFEQIPSIACPVLVIGDTNDRTLGVEGSKEIASRIACPIYLYDEYSHAVYDEAPDIKDRILEFLR